MGGLLTPAAQASAQSWGLQGFLGKQLCWVPGGTTHTYIMALYSKEQWLVLVATTMYSTLDWTICTLHLTEPSCPPNKERPGRDRTQVQVTVSKQQSWDKMACFHIVCVYPPARLLPL